jgi:hypothetical protein
LLCWAKQAIRFGPPPQEERNAPFLVGIATVGIIVFWIIYTYKPSILHSLIFAH